MALVNVEVVDSRVDELSERVSRNEQIVTSLTSLVNTTANNVASIVATCNERSKNEGHLAIDITMMSAAIASGGAVGLVKLLGV